MKRQNERLRTLTAEKLNARLLLAGDLDPQFGQLGWLADPIVYEAPADDVARASTIDASGRMLVLGDTTDVSGARNLLSVTRLLPSGSIDPSFNSGTSFTLGLATGDESGIDVAVQDNGRILVLANVQRNDSNASGSFVVVGLRPDGRLDTSFGEDGILEGAYTYPRHFEAGALALGVDDSIYIHYADHENLYLTKHLRDGQVDPTYGENGTFTYLSSFPRAQDVIVDQRGRAIVASSIHTDEIYEALVVRVTSEGQLDTNFGTDGTVAINTANDRRYGDYGRIRLASDFLGSVFVAGMRRTNTDQDFFVHKLDSSGTSDSSFGNNGEAFIETGGDWGTLVQELVLNPSGEIYLSGTLGYNRDPLVVRLDPDGDIGPSDLVSTGQQTSDRGLGGGAFNPDTGRLTLAYTSDNDIYTLPFDTNTQSFVTSNALRVNTTTRQADTEGNDIIELPSGNLLASSTDYHNDSFTAPYRVHLTRYLPDGTRDTSYGIDGRFTIEAQQYFGRIPNLFVAGNSETFLAVQDGYDLRIARLNVQGEVDTQFGNAGWISWTLPSGPMTITQIDSVTAVDDGFIVTGGGRSAISNDGYLIVKLDREGNPVATFGEGGQIKIAHAPASGRDSQIQVQSDGKLLLLMGHADGSRLATVHRYHANGTLDISFAQAGVLQTPFYAYHSFGRRQLRVLSTDSFLVLSSQDDRFRDGKAPSIAKYTSDGELDASFGVRSLPMHLNETLSSDLLIDSQNRIVVLARSSDSRQDDPVVYRMLPSGELDPSFGDAGSRRITRNTNHDEFTRLAETADGDLLVAGSAIGPEFRESAFLRLREVPPAWHNTRNIYDVDNDGIVAPIDVLQLVNLLNRQAGGSLPNTKPDESPYYDVNGDEFATPIDALLIINWLNAQAEGEGETSLEHENVEHENTDKYFGSIQLAPDIAEQLKKKRLTPFAPDA